MSKNKDLIVVYTGTANNANILNTKLKKNGIETFIKNETMAHNFPWHVSPGGVTPFQIEICEKDFIKAKPIIQEFLKK